jgi:superfamily II DNA/RNA helicase
MLDVCRRRRAHLCTDEPRQTVLFSATLGSAIGRLSARLTRDPARVEVKGERAAPVAIGNACASRTTIRTSIGSSTTCSPTSR